MFEKAVRQVGRRVMIREPLQIEPKQIRKFMNRIPNMSNENFIIASVT